MNSISIISISWNADEVTSIENEKYFFVWGIWGANLVLIFTKNSLNLSVINILSVTFIFFILSLFGKSELSFAFPITSSIILLIILISYFNLRSWIWKYVFQKVFKFFPKRFCFAFPRLLQFFSLKIPRKAFVSFWRFFISFVDCEFEDFVLNFILISGKAISYSAGNHFMQYQG